jgi:hypothetical protein
MQEYKDSLFLLRKSKKPSYVFILFIINILYRNNILIFSQKEFRHSFINML